MKEAPEWSAETVFKAGFFFELALVPAAALLAWITRGTPFPFPLSLTPKDCLIGIIATLPLLGGGHFLLSRLGRRMKWAEEIYECLRKLLGQPIRAMTFQQLVLLSAAAGLGEEVLFRGVLQTLINLWASSFFLGAFEAIFGAAVTSFLLGALVTAFAIIVTSLLFGLFHPLTKGYVILAFIISVYLGWLFSATRNLLVPILVHSIYDTFALYFFRRRVMEDDGEAARAGGSRSPGQPGGQEDPSHRDNTPPL
jgi:hypothetical protein